MATQGKQGTGPNGGFADDRLSVSFRDVRDVRVVSLNGAAQLDQYDAFRRDLLRVIAPEVRGYAIHVAGLSFIGSPGLSALVEFRNAVSGRLWLAEPRPSIANLFRLARLTGKLRVCATLDDAIDQAAQCG